MTRLLLFYASVASFAAFTTSDLLIEGPGSIRKRSVANDGTGIEIYSLKIDSKVTSRFAHNVITSRAVNRASESQEVFFDVDLPKTAFITNFSMIIDGVTYAGTVKEKEVAKKQYDAAVSRGQTAGLVKASGRKTEQFTVSVNVASHGKVTFELIYEELLKRRLGNYEIFLKVKPKQLINHFQIEADIYEPQGLKSLDAKGTFITNDLLPVIKTTFSGNKGHVSFKPTLDQQRSCANCSTSLLDGDFTITYDVNRESPANVQIVNGYFVHFFAPTKLQSVPKNVVFVIDKSGSMEGRKMEQTKDALLKILADIKEHDHFNFILFDNNVEPWKTNLIPANAANVEEAIAFVKSIHDNGWTNINDPLLKAVEMLNYAHEHRLVPEKSASIIILLTDGQANGGETNPEKIQENAKNAIQGRYTLYSLGFGRGVNFPFLEKLALENSGVARRIYEDSDSALQLQGFYDEVANPLLVDVQLQYPENQISDVTQNRFKNYYDGSEIVVAGRITDNDLNTFTADVQGLGAENVLTFPEKIDIAEREEAQKKQEYIFGDYIERLWAYLTIQQLLEKKIQAKGGEKENVTAQALDLSLKYHFVTPLTSMVVTKPEDEKKDEPLIADKPSEGRACTLIVAVIYVLPNCMLMFIRSFNVIELFWCFIYADQVFGYGYLTSGYLPPAYNPVFSVDSDPHFIIHVRERNDSLCFNIDEEPGVVLNLVRDPYSGITVNGQLIGDKKASNSAKQSNHTYFGKIGIIHKKKDLKIEVTPQKIIVRLGKKTSIFSWLESGSMTQESMTLIINKKKNCMLSTGDGATFVIVLHQVWKKHLVHQDFLGFYVMDSHKFSEKAHGLLGQFFHGVDFEVSHVHPSSDPKKPHATMVVKRHTISVTRGWQKEYTTDPKMGKIVPCWFVHFNGTGLIDGVHTDYIVPSLLSTV
ncbi:inter-alpha-trypsin inhibitor heavy chain H3-like [Ambystoma mexicanum]|uniref:inter-alpha-trypsin inhibitor heavy chain H3-like n=1 Tax=Ambystoma mexicanum TaxID=8296 RepID=UPI0037E7531A